MTIDHFFGTLTQLEPMLLIFTLNDKRWNICWRHQRSTTSTTPGESNSQVIQYRRVLLGVLVFSFTVLNEHGYFGAPIHHYCRLCEALNYNKWAFWLIKPNRIMNMFSFMLSFREEKLYEDLTDSWSRFSKCRKGFERNFKRYKIWLDCFFSWKL